jgi:hypothetical protein
MMKTDHFIVFLVPNTIDRDFESEPMLGRYDNLVKASKELNISSQLLSQNLNGGDPVKTKNGVLIDCRYESGYEAWVEWNRKNKKKMA